MTRLRLTLAINTGAQFLGRVISSGTTFLTSIILARTLGTAGYGEFSKITTFVAFFYLGVDFGINAIYLQSKTDDPRLKFGHLLGIRILLSLFNIFVSLAILAFLPGSGTQGYTPLVRIGIILYSLSILSQGLITTANAEFQHRLEYHFATIALAVGSLVTLALLYLGAGNSVLATIIVFILGSYLTMSASLAFVKHFGTSLVPVFDLQTFFSLLKKALPLSITLVFNIIYFRVDTIVMTLTRSTIDVGIYNFAYKFFEFPLTLPVFFLNALYPVLLKDNSSSSEQFYERSIKSAVLLGILSLPVLCLTFIGASYLPLVNAGFLPSVQILRILSLGIPFFFLSNLTMWMLITLKRNTALVCIYGFSMVLVSIVDALVIPVHGPVGAAWITVLGEGFVLAISTIVLLINTPRRQGDTPKRIITS